MANSSQPRERAARIRVGSYEFKKVGISRFDLRDPYHLAVTLTWPGYLAALFGLYLSANLVFAVLFWLVPGSIANARPHSLRTPCSSASRRSGQSAMATCTR